MKTIEIAREVARTTVHTYAAELAQRIDAVRAALDAITAAPMPGFEAEHAATGAEAFRQRAESLSALLADPAKWEREQAG